MFEDLKVELLPERTTMFAIVSQNGNYASSTALNVLNINVGRHATQFNVANSAALAGSNVFVF
jgi:hypothetical protein